MDMLREQRIDCPYCGESITVLMDLSGGGQSLIEDCQVCCQPISIEYGLDTAGQTWMKIDRAQ